MSDDVWAVSQDLPALLNSFAGIKSDKPAKAEKPGKSDKPGTPSKGGKGSKPEPLPNIPKAQVIPFCSKSYSNMQPSQLLHESTLHAFANSSFTSCMAYLINLTRFAPLDTVAQAPLRVLSEALTHAFIGKAQWASCIRGAYTVSSPQGGSTPCWLASWLLSTPHNSVAISVSLCKHCLQNNP